MIDQFGFGRVQCGQFLHARLLSFAHPEDQRPMSFTSELPPDLDAALGRAQAQARERGAR